MVVLSPLGFEQAAGINEAIVGPQTSALKWRDVPGVLTWGNMGEPVEPRFTVRSNSEVWPEHFHHSGRALAAYHAAATANGEDTDALVEKLPAEVQAQLAAVGGWKNFSKTTQAQRRLEDLAGLELAVVTGGPARYEVRERMTGNVLVNVAWAGKWYDTTVAPGVLDGQWANAAWAALQTMTKGTPAHEVTAAAEAAWKDTPEQMAVRPKKDALHAAWGIAKKDVLYSMEIYEKGRDKKRFEKSAAVLLYKNADDTVSSQSTDGTRRSFAWVGLSMAYHHAAVESIKSRSPNMYAFSEETSPAYAEWMEGKPWGGVAGLRACLPLHEYLNEAVAEGLVLATENGGRRVTVCHPRDDGGPAFSKKVADVIFYDNLAEVTVMKTGEKINIDYTRAASAAKKQMAPLRRELKSLYLRDIPYLDLSVARQDLRVFRNDVAFAEGLAKKPAENSAYHNALSSAKQSMCFFAKKLWRANESDGKVRALAGKDWPKVAFWAGRESANQGQVAEHQETPSRPMQPAVPKAPQTPEELKEAWRNGMKVADIRFDQLAPEKGANGQMFLTGAFKDEHGNRHVFKAFDRVISARFSFTPAVDMFEKLGVTREGYVQGTVQEQPNSRGSVVHVAFVSTPAEFEVNKRHEEEHRKQQANEAR